MTSPATAEHPTVADRVHRFEFLSIDQVVPSKTNPRTHFDDTYIQELAGSIKEKGLIQPILVRQVDAGKHKENRFEIVAAECRYRASKLAGETSILSMIRVLTNEQVLELQLIENIHRKDLTALEQAEGYRRLIKSNPDKHSAASIAQRIGMSEPWVWDRLKLNDLIPDAKKILDREQMNVGHAILIARLKPEDQERAIDPDNYERWGVGGLWQEDHGRLQLDAAEERKLEKSDKYYDKKTVSVRELETWIRDHVRFDVQHAAKAQPLEFETALTRVSEAEAKPGRGRKVISITHEYRVADDARDADGERTYGSQSWKRADGDEKSKTCEYSVLGVIVAGDGQGDTLQVCVARDRCKVHFADVVKAKEKAAKLREEGKGKKAAKVEKKAEESYDAKWKREQAERHAREKAWGELHPHLMVDILAQVKATKALTAAHAKELTSNDFGFDRVDLEKHLGKTWFKQPVQAILLMAAMPQYSDGFDDYVKQVAKPLGLDIKRLEAIRDKHQPKPEPKADDAKGKKVKKAKAA